MTLATLEKRLWFHAHSIKVRIAPLEGADGIIYMHFGTKRILLRMGLRRKAKLSALLHELLHDACRTELAMWGDLDETVTRAVERDMLAHVCASKRRLGYWTEFLNSITRRSLE